MQFPAFIFNLLLGSYYLSFSLSLPLHGTFSNPLSKENIYALLIYGIQLVILLYATLQTPGQLRRQNR